MRKFLFLLPLVMALRQGRAAEPSASPMLQQAYDRLLSVPTSRCQWALSLLEQTLAGLRREYEQQGQGKEFEQLKECLTAERGAMPYADIAASMGMSEGAVRVATHRMRRRFRALFRSMVASTLADEAGSRELDDELRYVARLLSRDT